LDDIAGGALGWILGERLRAHAYERRYRRAAAGKDVAVGMLAHVVGAPEWRDTAGVLRRRAGRVTWSPRLWGRLTSFTAVPPRRWKAGVVNLDMVRVIGTRTRRAAARGDRVVFELTKGSGVDYLAVRPEALQIAEVLLRGDRGHDGFR
jgi:hypothetical protein